MDDRRRIATGIGWALIAASLVVLLVGWVLGVEAVTTVLPGLSSMKVNTALGILGLGVCTVLDVRQDDRSWYRPTLQAVAAIVSLLGLLTVVEYLADVDLGIDQALITDAADEPTPGRMGLNTAVALASLGLSWLLLARRPAAVRWHVAAQAVASVGGFLALFAFVGYLLGSTSTRGIGSATEMAVHTSLLLVLATIGMAVATSERGPLAVMWSPDAGGRMMRTLLLPLAGVLLGVGVAVELAETAGVITDVDLALAVTVTSTLIILAGLVNAVALRTDRVHQREQRAVAERVVAQEELARVLEDSNARLTAMNTELEARVRARTRELEEAIDDLSRSNADLAQFAYVASHDMKEPLRMVSAYCHRIADRYGDALDDRGRIYVDLAVDGADRMQEMVDALLRYSRVGQDTLTMEPVDLGELVEEVTRRMPDALEGVDLQVDPDLPTVVVDRSLFANVVQNLVGNAAKFRHPDRPPAVRVRAGRTGDGTVELTVQDNGIGIPPEKRDQVFRMFARLQKRTSYEGTGIGLALTQRIVDRHGGMVLVDDSPLGGAQFTVRLPSTSRQTDMEAP